MLYSHVPYHYDTIINRRNDKDARRIKTQEVFFNKISPLTLLQGFVWGFTVRGSWRPNITEICWSQCYGCQRCVFLVLHGCSTGALESTLLGAGFPYYISSNSSTPTLLNCPLARRTQLSFCSICRPYFTFKLPRDRDVSLLLSLESPEWSSSSGNNCHAVQRPLSSGASVYESIMGFFLPRPISSANFRPCDFLS